MEILLLLTLLIFKHFIADFILQTPKMVAEKGTWGAFGGIHHSLHHFGGTFIVFFQFMNPLMVLVLATIDFVLHYHIDYIKMNLTQGYTPADKIFWIYLGIDQMLHYLTYVLLVLIAIIY